MNLKIRLALLQFIQFSIWGSWLITISAWWFGTKHWTSEWFGLVFSTMGIASIFMPTIAGIIADRWMNAEKVYGIFLFISALFLISVPHCQTPFAVFVVMFISMCFYMPTISLSITVSYSAMSEAEMNIVKEFPKVRVFGTIGFIVAMWTVSLLHLETSSAMFYIAGIASVILGLYAFTMPKCKPMGKNTGSLFSALGLDAFRLFKDYNMALFFIFSMLLAGALQLTNAYGDTFLQGFKYISIYRECIAVKYPAIIMSISQMSETLCILMIPFVLRKFGIKVTMMISMFAWVLRFGLFGFGNPGSGLWMIILSCLVYGVAFDFFNISGSLYTELNSPASIRASAQGLFMMMTNGAGTIFGSSLSGWLIGKYYTNSAGVIQWQGFNGVWIAFAIYALIVGILFTILFKYKHDPSIMDSAHH